MSVADTETPDARVLDLRGQGRSFGSIAKLLGYERASDANEAFNRALRLQPAEEQAAIRAQESERLDVLESKVRELPDGSPEIDRRLRTIARLRELLSAE